MSAGPQVLELAEAMRAAGCSLVPVGQDKKPVVPWKAYQTERAGVVKLRMWAAKEETTGFAVICGAVSGGLEILDFDAPVMYAHFLGSLPDWAQDVSFPVQQTGGGGYQLAYRRSAPGGNKKLAWSPAVDEDGEVIEGRQIGIETRGEGGYAVIPHSLHPTGNRYQPTLGNWADIPSLTNEQAEELLTLARSFDQTPEPKLAPAPATPKRAAPPAGDRVTEVRRKYAREGFGQELEKLGSTREGGRNDALNAAAFAAGQLITSEGELDEVEARHELEAAAHAIGLDPDEIAATIDSGIEAGKADPRDLSGVGQRVKPEKRRKGGPAGAGGETAEAEALPTVDEIPDPEGEAGKYYTDEQLLELLGLSDWPIMGLATDRAHALRLALMADGDLAYVPELGGYVAWASPRWVITKGRNGRGTLLAQETAAQLGLFMRPELERLLALWSVLGKESRRLRAANAEEAEIKNAEWREKAMEKAHFAHVKAAKLLENVKTQKNVLEEAAPQLQKPVELFEPRPWLVPFLNGTWQKGEFGPPRREDYQTATAAVSYAPDADRTVWLEVLDRMTGGDADLARTLQEVAGYALSGASSHRVLPWPYGPKGTGKSTYTELILTVLGDMAITVDGKKLAKDSARERLGADLWGKRVAVFAEAGNSHLDAELLKTLSGSDRIPARLLFAEAFQFTPSHVLFMVANDPPKVEAYDDALKDRVLALPFVHSLDISNPLKGLGKERIEVARRDPRGPLVQGFAAWAVEGMNRVYETGQIHRARVCDQAKRDFWAGVDPLTDFWLEQDVSVLSLGVGVTELRGSYETWCEQQGARPLGRNKWNTAARAVGLEQISRERKEWVLQHRDRFPVEPPSGEDSTVSRPFDRFEGSSEKAPRERGENNQTLKSFAKRAENGRTVEEQASGWEGEPL